MAPVKTFEDLEAEQAERSARIQELDEQFEGQAMPEEARSEWNALNEESDAAEPVLKELRARKDRVRSLATDPVRTERESKSVNVRRSGDIFDLAAVDRAATSLEDRGLRLRDNAMRALEGAVFADGVDEAKAKTHIARLLDTIDHADPLTGKEGSELARRILVTGNPEYKRAFGKYLQHRGQLGALSPDEQRALSVGTGSAGGFAVVYELDPTVVPTSNFSVNPWRALARQVTIAGTNEWKAVTSGAITAAYGAEATEASDNAPTLAQPDIIVEKAQAYVPFSIEVGQDWSQIQQELTGLLQDSKDDLEATKFALGAGHGSTEPKGVITGATNTVGTTTTAAFVIGDLYKLFEALPARFRPRAAYAANLFILNKIRQFDTSGGSGVWIGPQGLQPAADAGAAGTVDSGLRIPLLGRSVFEATAMDAVLTTTSKILLVGDFRYFVIVDRVGMNVEFMPLVVGTNHRPTGQRGLYAYWRNSSDVLSAAAFRVLVT